MEAWPSEFAVAPDLLDELDTEHRRISNLGRWKSKDDSQLLALVASFATLQQECSSLKALLASKDLKPTPSGPKKPPKWQEGDPEMTELDGTTWKWCAKCFNRSWNKTHVTSEHVRGQGKQQQHQQPRIDDRKAHLASADVTPPPPSDDATNSANMSVPATFELDFM